MARIIFLLLTIIAVFVRPSYSQTEHLISASYENEEISKIFDDLSSQTKIKINFQREWLANINFTGEFKQVKLGDVLREVVAGKGFAFLLYNSQYYIIRSNSISLDMAQFVGLNLTEDELGERLRTELDDKISNYADLTYYRVSGLVSDGKTDQPVTGVAIKAIKSGEAVVSNLNGNYELLLSIGKHELVFSGLGYGDSKIDVIVTADTVINTQMFEAPLVLDELVISVNNFDERVNSVQSSVETIKIETMESLPTFLGEVDVIKSLLILPGVSSIGEGAGGFNVRGGSTDENLILMDGIPIFNSSHIFGFFSVFNGDVIDQFTLYKGGIPSRFGGRTSSILDVRTKKGDMEKLRFSGSIGTVSAKAKIELPLKKEKSSLALGVRSAYPTWLFGFFPDDDIKESSASFYDLNAMFLQKFNKGSELSISTYNSQDKFRFAQDTLYNWRNFGISSNYVKVFNEKNSLNIGVVYSNYDNGISGKLENNEFIYANGIDYLSFSGVFLHAVNTSDIFEIGIQSNLYNINRGEIHPDDPESSIIDFELGYEKALESGLYMSYDKKFSNRISAQVGLRVSHYTNIGPGTVYSYTDPNNPTLQSVTDSTLYGDEFYGGVLGFEPRVNINYNIDEFSSIKLGYNLMRQYIHQISITSAIAPGDYWKLSDPNLLPTIANQINLGYFKLIRDYAISVEGYYKGIENLIDYKDGANIFLKPQIETALITTSGRAYGVEFKLEKRGRLSGWISYTLSRSERESLAGESVNKYIPTNYDKPHDIGITGNYKISRRLSIATNFVYSTGRPITVPKAGYFYNGQLIVDYTERNSERIPPYHRLDFSIILKSNLRKDKTYRGKWVFSIYNLYGRKNPYSVYFDTVAKGQIPQGYKLSILGTAFPSISYSFVIQ